MYIVVKCLGCGNLILGKTHYRTRTCPHCGYRTILRSMKVLGRTNSSQEAVTLIQTLKKEGKGT